MSWAVESRKTWIVAPATRAPFTNSMLCPLLLTVTVPVMITPFCETCRAPGRVEVFMGVLVNKVIAVVVGTLVAPLPGRMLMTVGAAVDTAGMVVNWLVVLARALPERSVIRLVAVTVRVAPAGNSVLL